jgi:hypothetical protein
VDHKRKTFGKTHLGHTTDSIVVRYKGETAVGAVAAEVLRVCLPALQEELLHVV